jgi:HK97 family phage major capsid protein
LSQYFGTFAPKAEMDKPLPAGARFSDALGIAPASERGLSLGKHLRGTLTGDWRGAEREHEYMQRAMGGSSVGGLLPVAYSSELVDIARPLTQVLNAGARIVPLSNRQVIMPLWQTDPTLGWRSEGAAVNQSDAALGSVTFNAQSCAGYTTLANELIEDTDISDLLSNAYGKALSVAFDSVALLGTGTAPQPRGLKNFASITDKSAVVVNGQTPTWDNLCDMVGGVLGRNERVTAIIDHPRNELALGKAKASTSGDWLNAPQYIANIPRYATGTLPVNEVEGTSGAVCNTAFAGDFGQLFLGIRTNVGIRLYDAPAATTGQTLMVCWFRADVQIGRPSAFAIRTGLKA